MIHLISVLMLMEGNALRVRVRLSISKGLRVGAPLVVLVFEILRRKDAHTVGRSYNVHNVTLGNDDQVALM